MTRIETLDTTLRDGTQSEGASLSIEDKLRIIAKLDALGVTYIEAGYPASNAKDARVFEEAAKLNLANSRLVAFSMTCRKDCPAAEDEALIASAACCASTITIVGKASAEQVERTLGASKEENLRMIRDSVSFIISKGKEALFDAEHFFDGYAQDRDYSIAVALEAAKAGAKVVVLCDTNGRAMPYDVYSAVKDAKRCLEEAGFEAVVGVHMHDDCGCAVANTIEAIMGGARHVQGSINGYGERVGNANLLTIIGNIELRMGMESIGRERCKLMTSTANYVAEIFNRSIDPGMPFVGSSAFAHKGGLHVSALSKFPSAYGAIDPEDVGNLSHIVVSELSGRSALLAKSEEFGIDLEGAGVDLGNLAGKIKDLECSGYSFELADATLELLFREAIGEKVTFFRLESFRVITEKHEDGKVMTEATIKIHVGDERFIATGEGNGPVNALDMALRQAITRFYPQVANILLTDFKVRVLDEASGTDAVTRVIIESSDGKSNWATVGVSANIIEASWNALVDSLAYGLIVKGMRNNG
ncbi:MAG: citramalate synthase [bacterium]|nr:citramalate synthase [bacterium]